MLRIASPICMRRSREIFGVTFAIGCRNMPPLKGEGKRQLVYGDIVNIVHVAENDLGALAGRRYREIVALQSVDFAYNYVNRLLSIRIRYSNVLAQDAVVCEVLHLSVPEPQMPGNLHHRGAALGTAFLLNGSLVKVISSTEECATVRDVSSGAEHILHTGAVRDLVMEYVGF